MADRVTELIGVYNADGGLRGELTYIIGKLGANVHCELCDITHSPLRRKRAWDNLTSDLGVPFRLLHRNEVEPDSDVARAMQHSLPCVLARTQTGSLVLLLGSVEMAKADGNVATFHGLLTGSLREHDLSLPD